MMGYVALDQPATSPLIGRADDLERLVALAGIDAADPRPGSVLLSGDAGIGKTRLLTALRGRAAEAGRRVAVGHCLDFGDSALPYLPFSELFGRLDAEVPALVGAAMEAHPPLQRVVPGRRPPTDGEPGELHQVDRGQLFEAVHAALERFGASQPLLVVVEDVHWADQSTRDLLSFLFSRGFTTPVSVVVSYRSDDLHRRHPLRATLAQWTRLPGLGRVDLGPLPDRDVRQLVRVLHPAPLRESDVHAVVERAEGNAFFAEELVAATSSGDGAVPRDLVGLLLVRLDQLDDTARQVVRVASVAGRGTTHEVLAAVAGLDGAALEQAVRAAVEHHVLVPVGPDSYAFRHALLGEAVYDDLLPGERVRLHAAYVKALAGGDTTGAAAELARHARAGHDPATALVASIRAGDEATAAGGPAEALRHYELALELAVEHGGADGRVEAGAVGGDGDPIDTIELTVRASAAATAAGHVHRAVALVQDRLDSGTTGTPLQRAQLLHALATALFVGETTLDPLAVTTEALGLVPVEPPTVLRARVLEVHSRALADRQRDDDSARWAQEALTLARTLGQRDVIADASTTLARLQERAGDPDASKVALAEVIAEAHASGDVAELRGLHQLGGIHHERGELADALAVYLRGAERARELGRPWAPYGFDARLLAALVSYESGDWDAANRLVDVSGQSPPGIAEALLASAGLLVAAGRGDLSALDLLPQLRPWWGRDAMVAIFVAGGAIDLSGDAGDIDAAVEAYEAAVACVSCALAGARLPGKGAAQRAPARPARRRGGAFGRGRTRRSRRPWRRRGGGRGAGERPSSQAEPQHGPGGEGLGGAGTRRAPAAALAHRHRRPGRGRAGRRVGGRGRRVRAVPARLRARPLPDPAGLGAARRR